MLILVDQFEEFFTNTENFYNGKPSLNAHTTLNLLLETAKIALAENLPVYIICTMRSDYIGQCASFRGLPEYIGFSQFFVPRLKRKELVQVIEEPAILSGSKITKRLTEVLINELNEGIDQLPVLQHALNQIWKLADEENTEMDLIHFAKLGGMPASQLPEFDRLKFEDWFKALSSLKKEFLKSPSLSNVLDAHANELYETSEEHFLKSAGLSISKEEIKSIICSTFKCLTKIDENRAVRNRVTLDEITNIINNKNITAQKVEAVINLFRSQGNTFVRPFITEDENSKKLPGTTVLDITHESLIRNWSLLKAWVNEENDNRINFLDFKKQVDRWFAEKGSDANRNWWQRRSANKKAKIFLLPKGPLSFFSDWYYAANLNGSWLLKYDQRELAPTQKKTEAEEAIENCNEFLSRSKKVFTRKKQWRIGSIIWGVAWFIYVSIAAWQDQKQEAQNAEIQKKKAEKFADMKIDKINAKVIAPSSYIQVGSEYKADIFVTASSSQLSSGAGNIKIYLGKLDSLDEIHDIYDSVPVEEGMGKLSIKTTKQGGFDYEGQIQIKSPSGKIQKYPFSNSFMVAAPSVAVSIVGQKVIYTGINNYVSVSVAGVSPNDLIVTSSNAKVSKLADKVGQYVIKVLEAGEISINVSMKKQDGSVIPAGPPFKFVARKIPDPVIYYGIHKGTSKISRENLLNIPAIVAAVENFDLNAKFTIKSFELITIVQNQNTIISNNLNGDITKEMKQLMQKLKKGDKLLFDKIKTKGPDDKLIDAAPVVLELEN